MEFLVFKEDQGQWDQWAHLVCLENLELVNPVPLVTQENLVSQVCQEEMAVPAQWVCKDQRVTQELQAQGLQENQVKMVPQECLDLWELKVHKVLLDSQDPPACLVLEKQANLESQVAEGPLVLQEPPVRKVSQVQLVLLVCQVLLDLLVQLVPRGQGDSRVSQVL